ncbi:MAG TPA: polysaccharide biosynthesis tyrosine autokinase [Candidatus Acidoferrales bacterium]|nr:polysaccharide biosynthesis tyrosine autokinase [Candidatus Acidoferrales bacterium]
MQSSSTTGLPDAGMTAQGLAPPAGDEIDLRELLGILLAGKWTVILVTGVVVFLGVLYALSSTPVYQANALVQVETRGSSSLLDELQNLSALAGQESPGQTEIQILKSRYVSGQVVDHLVLDIEVEPRRFGILGRILATDQPRAGELAEPWLGLDRYAWGGEVLTVKRMKVPDQWLGKPLKLIALGGRQFKLHDPDGNALLSGRAGELATLGKDRNADSRVEIFVQELVARPGTEFMVTRKSRLETIETLRERLAISEQGKGTGILQLSLEGENPTEIAGILNDIARTYLRQNVERRSAQAEESLRFLDEQLPKLKSELESAEEAFNAFRKKHESLDLSVETQGLLQRIVEVETEISNLQLKRTQMGQSFASQHPTMIGIGNQIGELMSVKRELESRASNLPDTQQEILRLQRDVEVKSALYTGLLNKAQELRIIRAGTLGNVRIIDEAAVPEQPIKPRKSLIVLLSLLLGLFAGVVVVFLQRSFRRGVVDSRQLETELGLTVYASVPYSGKNRRLVREAARAGDTRMPVLAREAPQDMAVESLRSLATAMHFALLEKDSNVVAVTSSAPESGKTFLCANLAHLLGESGQRVLLIDGDLRRGRLHQLTGGERQPGLSEVLTRRATLDSAVRPLVAGKVDLLTTGQLPPNSSELLMSKGFSELIQSVRQWYDVILIDSPPVLAVADAGVIATHAGAVFLVVRAVRQTLDEVDATIRQLRNYQVQVTGAVFNAYDSKGQGSLYASPYYRSYEYSKTSA